MLKMMDDVLIEGQDMADLVQKSHLLFERCREKKLYFLRSKVQCGEEVIDGGMALSRKDI